MFCGNCGQIVENNSEPLKTFCPNCGAETDDSSDFCGNCGIRIEKHSEDVEQNENNEKSNWLMIACISLIATCILVASIVIIYSLYPKDEETSDDSSENITEVDKSKSKDKDDEDDADAVNLKTYYVSNCNEDISLREKPDNTSEVLKTIPFGAPVSYVESSKNGYAKVIYNGTTGYALQSYLVDDPADVKKPQKTQAPNNNNKAAIGPVNKPTYKTYYDSEYNFNCGYPSHFLIYTDSDPFVRFSAKAPDNSATLKICASDNEDNLSVSDVMYNFKSLYPGSVPYENSGNTWCATTIRQDTQSHYAFYRVESNVIKGFELHYSQNYNSIYDLYVNDIYDSLKFNP